MAPEVSSGDLLLLLFTSGTTGSPKAVRCTQGRLAAIGQRASEIYGFTSDEVCYCPMPLFHGNAVMALWAPALQVGACVALGGRFSASRFIDDVRQYRATRFTYVGKALAYVLATPARPDDADTPLRVGFGTEASARDRSEFEARFGCTLVEGYGSSEGGLAITRTPETPPDALGIPGEGAAVLDPETGTERSRALIDASGRLENPDEAIGELACRSGVQSFEGYFKNPEADTARVNDGWYWTGDLAYRDQAGFVYFAGRNDDWLRVDSENFAAAPVERILGRHPDVVAAAVYPVPDARERRSGDGRRRVETRSRSGRLLRESRHLSGRSGRPRDQVGSALRPDRRGPPSDGDRQDHQGDPAPRTLVIRRHHALAPRAIR